MFHVKILALNTLTHIKIHIKKQHSNVGVIKNVLTDNSTFFLGLAQKLSQKPLACTNFMTSQRITNFLKVSMVLQIYIQLIIMMMTVIILVIVIKTTTMTNKIIFVCVYIFTFLSSKGFNS